MKEEVSLLQTYKLHLFAAIVRKSLRSQGCQRDNLVVAPCGYWLGLGSLTYLHLRSSDCRQVPSALTGLLRWDVCTVFVSKKGKSRMATTVVLVKIIDVPMSY